MSGEFPYTRGGALAPDVPAKFAANENPTSLSDQRGGPLGRVPRANPNIQKASLVMHGGMDSDERDEPGGASPTDDPDIQLAANGSAEIDVNVEEYNLPGPVEKIFSGDSDGPEYATSLENTFALGAGRTAAAIPKSLALAGVGIRNELLDWLENAYRYSIGAGVHEDDIRDQIMAWAGEAFGDDTQALVEAFFEADRGVRSELIRILRKIPSDPEEFEIYKAGVRFDEWMRDNFEVSDEYGDDFYHQVMNGLGSAMPLMVAAILTGGASIPGTAAAAMVGAAQGASAEFEKQIGGGVPLEDALKESGLAAAYNLVNALPISGILGRLAKNENSVIHQILRGGVDNLAKDFFIKAIEEFKEEERMFFDEETGEFFYEGEEGAVSFTAGNLLAMLTAMVLGK